MLVIMLLLSSAIDFSSDRLLRAYVDELITIALPPGKTICDVGNYTLWCRLARVFFTRIEVPSHIHDSFGCGATTTQPSTTPTPTPGGQPPVPDFQNCIRLDDATRLSWTLDRSRGIATFKLCGCLSTSDLRSASMRDRQYRYDHPCTRLSQKTQAYYSLNLPMHSAYHLLHFSLHSQHQ